MKRWVRNQGGLPSFIRFETEPSHRMQLDWAVIRPSNNRLSAFVATLGWNRA